MQWKKILPAKTRQSWKQLQTRKWSNLVIGRLWRSGRRNYLRSRFKPEEKVGINSESFRLRQCNCSAELQPPHDVQGYSTAACTTPRRFLVQHGVEKQFLVIVCRFSGFPNFAFRDHSYTSDTLDCSPEILKEMDTACFSICDVKMQLPCEADFGVKWAGWVDV